MPAEAVDAELDTLGITVSPFGQLDARLTASFFPDRSGLSPADRVCLAPAGSLSSPGLHHRSPRAVLGRPPRRRRSAPPRTVTIPPA